MQIEAFIGIAAGVLTGTSMLPQLIKLIREKKAEGISTVMLIVLIAGLTLWFIYGIMRNDIPIYLTNGFSWVVNVTLLILRQVYKKRQSAGSHKRD